MIPLLSTDLIEMKIMEDLWYLFANLIDLIKGVINQGWTSVFECFILKEVFQCCTYIAKNFELDWIEHTEPLYNKNNPLKLGACPLGTFLWTLSKGALYASYLVLTCLLRLWTVVSIFLPLDYLITLWFICCRSIPFCALQYPTLRITYVLWYSYSGASTWVQVWRILTHVVHVPKVLLGQEVKVRLGGQHFFYATLSILFFWKLHLVAKHPDLKEPEEEPEPKQEDQEIDEDFLKDFGGTLTYAEGEGKHLSLPKTKLELRKIEIVKKIRKHETEEKVRNAVDHFLEEHEDSYLSVKEVKIFL